MITIRDISIDEIDDVLRLHQATAPWYRINRAALTEYITETRYKIVGIYRDDMIIGIIILMIVKDEADIIFIETSTSARRLGYGLSLINWVTHEYNLHDLYLEVNKTNEAAIAFYKKIGFITVGNRRNYYKSGDGLIMRYSVLSDVTRET